MQQQIQSLQRQMQPMQPEPLQPQQIQHTPQLQQVRLRQSSTPILNIQQQAQASSLQVQRLLAQCRRQPAQSSVRLFKQPALPNSQQQQLQQQKEAKTSELISECESYRLAREARLQGIGLQNVLITQREKQLGTLIGQQIQIIQQAKDSEPQPSTSVSGYAQRSSIQLPAPSFVASSPEARGVKRSIFKSTGESQMGSTLAIPLPDSPSSDPYNFDDD